MDHDLKGKSRESKPEPTYDIAMSREAINAMPIQRYAGPVTVATDAESVEAACRSLRRESVLGFDTETRPSFRKGEAYDPALIQLAGARRVALFPLPDGRIPTPLKALLGDPDVIKTGVAMDYDLRKLTAMDPFEAAGFVSLEPMAIDLRIRNQGLRGLAAALLGFRISKRAQCSNWSRRELTEAQITYAATDAWVSRLLYVELTRRVRLKERAEGRASRPTRERNTAALS